MRALGLLLLLIGSVASLAFAQCGGASNSKLEAKAKTVIATMKGHLVMPGGGEYECWCHVDGQAGARGHWGVTYPGTLNEECKVNYAANTVCVSGGLPRSTCFRGYTMTHESMHLYMWRLQEAGLLKGFPYDEVTYESTWIGAGTKASPGCEHFTDCLAKAQGAPLLNNLPGYGCPSWMLPYAKSLIKKYPPTSNKWFTSGDEN